MAAADGHRRTRRAARALLPAMLLVLILASLLVGSGEVTVRSILAGGEGLDLVLISRLPRTLAALLAGASMAVAGTILQMLARNRFVEPAMAGTAESAALGLIVATLLLPDASILAKMTASSAAALIGTAAFLWIVNRLPPTQPLLVPLVGIIFGGILMSIATFIAYETDLLQFLSVWLNGEFSGVMQGRYELLWLSGLLALAAYAIADQFTIVGLGRDASISLGLNYRQVLFAGLAIVALITAFTTTTIGMLPFVGLVVPNIVSRFLGDNVRATLPAVAFTGAGFVLACDLVGRLLRYPYEIPAGTVFGVIGTIVFLWLLFSPSPRGAGRHA